MQPASKSSSSGKGTDDGSGTSATGGQAGGQPEARLAARCPSAIATGRQAVLPEGWPLPLSTEVGCGPGGLPSCSSLTASPALPPKCAPGLGHDKYQRCCGDDSGSSVRALARASSQAGTRALAQGDGARLPVTAAGRPGASCRMSPCQQLLLSLRNAFAKGSNKVKARIQSLEKENNVPSKGGCWRLLHG